MVSSASKRPAYQTLDEPAPEHQYQNEQREAPTSQSAKIPAKALDQSEMHFASPGSGGEEEPWQIASKGNNKKRGGHSQSLPTIFPSSIIDDSANRPPCAISRALTRSQPASPAPKPSTTVDVFRQMNWRDPTAIAALEVQRKLDNRSASSKQSQKTVEGLPITVIMPGVLTWHWDRHLFPIGKKVIVPDGGKLEVLDNGEQVLHKGRYWVVLEVISDELVEVPIYTFKDKGLLAVREDKRQDYAQIRPPHIAADDFLSRYKIPRNPVLGIAELHQNAELRKTMLAHVAKPQTRELSKTAIRRVATMDAESFEAFKVLVEKRRVQ
ncbi:hypothetical protein B0A48_10447 [Cryoendolithus antarcticus]|uniref:Uncharacterized protein n=1 Tax=Cryoendolithus antarcticus TaxID=1507870 RepID=A0A1V8SXD0_9PEZI|nr:hypothetical protein B0A48_10447 [Cryoendolithus antarcticus]